MISMKTGSGFSVCYREREKGSRVRSESHELSYEPYPYMLSSCAFGDDKHRRVAVPSTTHSLGRHV